MVAVQRRRCSKCGTNRALRFFPADRRRADGVSTVCSSCRKRKGRAVNRNVRLQKTYNISLEDYETILAHQGGGCAICEGKRPVYDVDHCHRTGRVRGLLCRRCNRRLLPAAQDRTDRLMAAVFYLQNPPAVAALGREVIVG